MIDGGTRGAHNELRARLRPFVARRVPASDIDDVLQDVFLRATRALPKLRDDQRFGPFLYQIARSAIAESRLKRSRLPVLTGEAGEPKVSDESGPSPLESEVAAYLLPLIAQLSSPFREALTLTELDGLTQREAAQRLGISVSGMKSRVQRGREKLRALLEDCCQIGVDGRGRVIECEPRDAAGCRCKSE